MFNNAASLPPPQVASGTGSRPRASRPPVATPAIASATDRRRQSSSAAQAFAAPDGERLRGKRVLLADGDGAMCEAVRAMLGDCGCMLEVVGDGEQALWRLRKSRFDLVLLASRMPRLDGFDVVRRLRGSAPGHLSTPVDAPVIALTAAAPLGDVDRCRTSGFSDHLGKPVRRERLLQILRRWVDEADPPMASASAAVRGAADDLPSADDVIIDMEAIRGIREMQRRGAVGLLRRLCAVFADTSEKLVDSIEVALAGDDAEALRRAAHTLKSASASLGAVRLSLRCAELEALGREGEVDAARAVWPCVRVDYERAAAALREIESEAVSA